MEESGQRYFEKTCDRCGKKYDVDHVLACDGVPKCECGGVIKPDVVLYEEALNDDTVNGAVNAIANADTLIIGGTSLNVYPAAGLIRYFKGNNLVIINMSPTQMDKQADLLICDRIGEVFSHI